MIAWYRYLYSYSYFFPEDGFCVFCFAWMRLQSWLGRFRLSSVEHVNQADFLLQALHGIKPCRVTSKSTDKKLAQKHKQIHKPPQPPDERRQFPSQDWSPSAQKTTERQLKRLERK